MKNLSKISIIALLYSALYSCTSSHDSELTTDTLSVKVDTAAPVSVVPDSAIKVENSKAVDSLLKKPVTTPSNNPFGLKAGDQLIKVGALDKDPLKSRLAAKLGADFDLYKKLLANSKSLKKDSDGFLYTSAKDPKSSNEAFFLYQHEKDVLFIGIQKDDERTMYNDMKSRMLSPVSVETWMDRTLIPE
jgi:hypothetical protein